MKTPGLMLYRFLLALICVPVLAEPQALITVDPNRFAPGQNISTATVGAQLRALYVVANPQLPGFNMPLENSGVYAQSVQPACSMFGLPCSPVGSNVLGYSPVSTPSAVPIFWGEANLAVRCLVGDCGSLQAMPSLRINFETPTNSVSALAPWFEGDGGVLYTFAFNSAGDFVDVCYGFPGQDTGVPGCTANLYSGSTFLSWVRYTMVHPTADISFVVIGGAANIREIAQVQFNSPVSVQLAGLLTKVKGVGPGKSLANKVMFAQAYYAVPDIQSTCATLTGFINEVGAQSGKSIGKPIAFRLLAITQAIEVGLGCH